MTKLSKILIASMKTAIEKLSKKRIRIIKTSDWHVPYHDMRVLKIIIKYCKMVQPDIIVIDEAHDFYKISKFSKDPRRKDTIQDEFDQANRVFGMFRRACPNARIVLLNSNHLQRLQKYVLNQAPELLALRKANLSNIAELMELEKHGVEFKGYLLFRGHLFKHGDFVAQDSGYTAKKEQLKEGCSGSSGHTHRFGHYFVTKRGGMFEWVEGGCACLDMDYTSGSSDMTSDWQRGFTEYIFEDKEVYAKIRHIKNNKLITDTGVIK